MSNSFINNVAKKLKCKEESKKGTETQTKINSACSPFRVVKFHAALHEAVQMMDARQDTSASIVT